MALIIFITIKACIFAVADDLWITAINKKTDFLTGELMTLST
jgi:hypothetical protein